MASELHDKAAEAVAEHRRWIEAAGRFGFATKGVVYGIIGVLAVVAAWRGGRAEGSEGAIREIGQQPFGQLLLWLVAAGMAGYALWQIIQALTGSDRRGSAWMIRLRRGGFLISSAVHVALAVYAAPVSIGRLRGESRKGLVEGMLSLPGGQILVSVVGALIIGFACWEIYRAWSQKFMQDYQLHEMDEARRNTALYTGIVGLAARGVTFLIVGIFVIIAAVRLDPSQAKGFGEALEVLARQPFGPWLLAIVGVGFICYAVNCGALALYRRFAVR